MLPPATEALWKFLQARPELRGFILIGGTALALHLRHRISEDLDFVWPALNLPRERLDTLRTEAEAEGFHFERADHQPSYEEFLIAGMDLHDSMQAFQVNGEAKVSFFNAEPALQKVLRKDWSPDSGRAPRVATIDEIFRSKCLVSADRSKTRDWFDLYVLMRDRGYTMRALVNAFTEAGARHGISIALSRLASGVPTLNDEGFQSLLPNPPTIAEMRDFFRERRDALEVELAAERFRETPPPAS